MFNLMYDYCDDDDYDDKWETAQHNINTHVAGSIIAIWTVEHFGKDFIADFKAT